MSASDPTPSSARRKPVSVDTLGRPCRHGLSFTPEYRTWTGINARCYNPKDTNFHRYGGRGIRVCESWRADFLAFFEDMGPRPGPWYSLDRIDVDGDYEPGNCRWTTAHVQCNNKTNNRRLEYCGWSLTVAEWAWLLKMSRPLIRMRLKAGWSIEETLTTPTATRCKQLGLPVPGKSARRSTSLSEAKNGRAKLTAEQVRAIRAEYRDRIYNGPELARRYGVYHATIYAIVKRKLWPNVE